ncbi:MAG: ABC transporter permease [Paracoccaceae bacterium]|nr:ABC transporter permease [Paracoccaceae bacterium]
MQFKKYNQYPIVLFALSWVFFVIVPLLIVVMMSFLKTKGIKIKWDWGFYSYIKMVRFGGDDVVLQTIRIGLTVTFINFLIAFPFAFWLAKTLKKTSTKLLVFTALTVPFFLSPVSRVIVWRSVLGLDGLVNNFLINIGLINQPLEWLIFSEFAVHLGLMAQYFPSMVWPLYLSLSLIDDETIEASFDLGAGIIRTTFSIILPLALPGVLAGVIFCLVPMLGDAVIPQQMGGGNVLTISHSLSNYIGSRSYVVGAAIASIVLLVLMTLIFILWLVLRPYGGLGKVFEQMKK